MGSAVNYNFFLAAAHLAATISSLILLGGYMKLRSATWVSIALLLVSCSHRADLLKSKEKQDDKQTETHRQRTRQALRASSKARSKVDRTLARAALLASAGVLRTAPGQSQTAIVEADTLNVRAGPALRFKRVSTLRRSWEVEMMGMRDGWVNIGTDMWVSAAFLRLKTP